MKRRLSVLLVLVPLLTGCGDRSFESIRKLAPVVLLVSLVALHSLARDGRLRRTLTPSA